MAETNDWITPQFDYGIPFWAKPPLSTWLSAGSIKLLGVSEFSVRLPSLLLYFFTFAGNIIWPYVLPGLPAFAGLAVELHRRHRADASAWRARGFIAACAVSLVGYLVLTALYISGNQSLTKASQRDLVRVWLAKRSSADSQLVYFNRTFQSAVFYSSGKARATDELADLNRLIRNNTLDFIAIKDLDLPRLPPELQSHFEIVAHFDDTTLLAEHPGAGSR